MVQEEAFLEKEQIKCTETATETKLPEGLGITWNYLQVSELKYQQGKLKSTQKSTQN